MQLDESTVFNRLTKLAAVVTVLLLVVLAVSEVYKTASFHVVSTDPNVNNVAAVAPYLKINFSQPLSGNNLSVSSSYSVITSYKIQGKTLLVNLKSPMTAGYAYYIKINHIADTKGQQLKNKVFDFTPKNVAWQNLTQDQQQALVKEQANLPRSLADVSFSGTNALTNLGLSSPQLSSLEQYLFDFDSKAQSIAVDDNSITVAAHNASDSSTNGSISFSIAIDSSSYNATVVYPYDPLGGGIIVSLYNPANNNLVFSSATFDDQEGTSD